MKTNKTLMLAVTLSLLAMQPYAVFAAGANSFRTDEYKNIGDNVLDLINAADAYAQGYTGKGVTVGVADIGFVNLVHPEFAGKDNKTMPDKINIENSGFTWADVYHPTHVAGIVAANKDGAGMHGVAFDSCIVSSSAESGYSGTDEDYSSSGYLDYYAYYLTDPDIKIINNSWGYTGGAFISLIQNEDDFEDTKNYALFNNDAEIIAKAVNRDKLLIFASGNYGHLNSDLISDFDILYGDKAYNDNIITVTAVKADSFTKKDDGSLLAASDAIAIFSNLAMYNEDTALTAPGWMINSVYADFTASESNYKMDAGTSMSTPMVTGVGALVQQAFPYLGGKQIGDVLLSTANNDITNDDGYFITTQYGVNEEGKYHSYINVYYTGSEQKDINNIKDDILNYYDENTDSGYYITYVDTTENQIYIVGPYRQALEEALNKANGSLTIVKPYYNVPLDVLFGQGIVDAGSAVKGLGAINVRRLDKSDISSDYTVAGVEGNTEQALYKVDTQGYNSVWSNDISEIRAGYIADKPLGEEYTDFTGADRDIKDLHDRWVFYTSNNFDNNPVGSDDHNWMPNHYLEQYNKWVEESGLLGLHAGLYKTGKGVLALTGNNTYKGASIAADGTLQIDGSVAGDAYSEGTGTIAGSGIINGSLYNYGTVQAGSWDTVTKTEEAAEHGDEIRSFKTSLTKNNVQTLNVEKDFTGDGVIAVNTDGTDYAKIHVNGDADISNMSLKAGTFAAPDTEGTFLTSDNAITVGNFNADFSGLLNSEVKQYGNGLTLTTTISNNAGITGDRFSAINGLYDSLSEDEQQEMYRLYALDNNELCGAMKNISASEGMHLELAHDTMQNRDVRQAVTRQQHLERDEAFWAISGKSWGDTDYGANRHSFNLTLGRDFYNADDAYAGVLFAYSDNSLYGNSAEGEYDNYTAALYGGTKNQPGTVTGYVSYGVQDNEMTRHLGSAFSHSGLSSKVESDYDSSVIGVGAKYAYDLHYGKEGWHLSPFAALDYAHYKQDSFTERGSVFGVHSGGFSDNYLTGELGLALDRQDNNGKYGFSLAYKRILDGDVQNTDFAFAKGGTGFGVSNTDGSQNHIIAAAYIGTKLSDKWEIGGSLEHDWSSASRDLSAAVQFNYYF